jgi:hypothetical protein
LENLREIAAKHVDELDDLKNSSGGVYGFHRNGDETPWGDVFPGGHYERLSAFGELRDAIVSHEIGTLPPLDDESRPAAQPAPPAPPAGGLVERVVNVLGHYGDGTARAAIREVAAWLDEQGMHGCSLWLREEVDR